ncbi:MAG: S8 family serine peptidase, partial [bacterium]
MHRLVLTILIFTGVSFANPYWIWLSDKGFECGSAEEAIALEKAENRLTERSIARRIKARGEDNIVDYRDIPPSMAYINQIEQAGAQIRTTSRTLNAVSVNAEPDVLDIIAQLPFVEKITFVAKRPYIPEPSGFVSADFDIDYGNSFNQNNMVNTPYAHRIGLHGDGVLISVTDTGFKLDHEAMAGTDLIAVYDFVDDDSIVTLEPGDPTASETHGTKAWSVIAGDSEGNLVGIARSASFLLARTEHYDDEYPGEEDHWIASAEWADSIGADIITLSLGYYEWYSPDSMTGDIAPISIAADRMAENGIIVTAAAGNNGAGVTTISAPGDADSIITVGAVNPDGNVSGFSSRGPT